MKPPVFPACRRNFSLWNLFSAGPPQGEKAPPRGAGSHTKWASVGAFFAASAMTLALTACGGGGGSGAANEPLSPAPTTPAAATTLGGSVVDGPVQGAGVSAFELAGDGTPKSGTPLATATTAADGSYTLTLPSGFSGTVVLTATGGSYCAGSSTAQIDNSGYCPAGTVKTGLGLPLSTVATAQAGTAVSTAHLTPVSTAALNATIDSNGVVSGAVATGQFAGMFKTLSGGLAPGATPLDLQPVLDLVNAMQTGTDKLTLAAVIESLRSGTGATALANASATTAQAGFDVKQGPNNLMPDDLAAAVDPTTLTTTSTGARTNSGTNGSSPYFLPRAGIDAATLKAIMEDTHVEDVSAFAATNVTLGNDVYTGYKLADVVVRATRFRPRDSNTGAFGATTAVVAFGANPDGSSGRVAAFSFTELIRTENGDKTIVAFQKNGGALPASEGALAIIPGNDDDKWLRKVARLKEIHIRNDYAATSNSIGNTDAAAAAFQVTGAVKEQAGITTAALSITSSQGYYAVDKIGSKPASAFKTYYFQEYGPRHTNYWYGQGVRLTDVLDTAGLKYPTDKAACFVTVTSANNQPALFSCGELYNSRVGRGDGLEGAASRSRFKGVLLVTDDWRVGSGDANSPVMMTCWNYASCTVSNAGDPASYPSALNTNDNKVNKQLIALISTEDYVPFQPQGRWFPFARTAAGARSCQGPTNCIPWVDVGERLQQNIKTMTVYYAAGTGNGIVADDGDAVPGTGSGGTGAAGGATASSTVCTHDQVMAGACVLASGAACSHLDYMAGAICYVPK
jgi:hypothetical protein